MTYNHDLLVQDRLGRSRPRTVRPKPSPSAPPRYGFDQGIPIHAMMAPTN